MGVSVRPVSREAPGVLAAMARRAASFTMDTAILAAVWVVTIAALPWYPPDADPRRIFAGLACLVAGFLYQWLFVWAFGATAGMRAVGLVVRGMAGRVPSITCAVRGAYFSVVGLAVVSVAADFVSRLVGIDDHAYSLASRWPLAVLTIGAVDLVVALLSADTRSLHDRILGTRVIDSSAASEPRAVSGRGGSRRWWLAAAVVIGAACVAVIGILPMRFFGYTLVSRDEACATYAAWLVEATALVQEVAGPDQQGRLTMDQRCPTWPREGADVSFGFEASDPSGACVRMRGWFERRFGPGWDPVVGPAELGALCSGGKEALVVAGVPDVALSFSVEQDGRADVWAEIPAER